MTDMQRFGYCSTCVCPLPKADGRWVLLADAEAAIAAAFRAGMEQMIGGIEQVSYDKGQRDMLAKCIDRMTDRDLDDLVNDDDKDVIFAAFRALQEKP
jgi:hypothetical protein